VARGASKIAIKVVLNNSDLYGAASAKTRFSSCASNWFEEGFLVNFFSANVVYFFKLIG
jgi:hypothetical protein